MESTKALLSGGVDVNIKSQPDRAPAPARAARASAPGRGGRGTPEAAAVARPDPNFGGSTALLVATVRGQIPLARFLLDKGADPNVLDAGFTPLFWAAGTWENGLANPVYGFVDPIGGITDRKVKVEFVKALLAHGANPNLQMTARPPTFRGTGTGGFNNAPGATAVLLAADTHDARMNRNPHAPGAEPSPRAHDQ